MGLQERIEPWRAWYLRDSMPLDSRDFVFARTAFYRVGQALYGGSWTGAEIEVQFSMPPMFARTDLAFGKTDSDWVDHSVLDRFGSQARRFAGQPADSEAPLTRELWETAWAEYMVQVEAWRASERRRCGAAARLVTEAQNGGLVTVCRRKGGGEYTEVPPSWWNVDNPWTRLRPLALNSASPFDLSAECDVWIFVDTHSLENVLKACAVTPGVVSIVTMQTAARECTAWLKEQFADPSTRSMTRDAFAEQAAKRWGDKLSGRAFQNTCWVEATRDFPERNLRGRRPRIVE